MSQETTAILLDKALSAEDRSERRCAFVELVGSEDWLQVLAPHVLSCQGHTVNDTLHPDWSTFEAAAPLIAESEDKIHRCLELAGNRFAAELLVVLARRMGADLVEHALSHLRTAEGTRAALLLYVLQEADVDWVSHPAAGVVIRRQLKSGDIGRLSLLVWLARAGKLGDYLELLEEYPPSAIEEWSALGLGGLYSEVLCRRALAILPHHPGPLLYLLRLPELPPQVGPRIMAAARGEWVAAALELAVADGLSHRVMIPLAELGVRLGGRAMAAANAWIGQSKLSRELLLHLAEEMKAARESGDSSRLNERLWIRRRAPSADRALEVGRRGEAPDLMDAAALVRQTRNEKAATLATEIIEEPREAMIEVLHLLCAVDVAAGEQVINLSKSPNPDVARRAQEAVQWTDVLWPDSEPIEE
jgi:hypothetical protein